MPIKYCMTASLFFLLSVVKLFAAPPTVSCLEVLTKAAGNYNIQTAETVQALLKFAQENNLPYKVLEVGPPERRVTRLFVGLDVDNPAALKAYREKFNLDQPISPNNAATLALEFQQEDTTGYVTGVVRTKANPEERIYRWAQPNIKLQNWWNGWMLTRQRQDGFLVAPENEQQVPVEPPGKRVDIPIIGYANLIGVSQKQRDNINNYFLHPENRGPCKSNNCVAWTSGIELGKTEKGATDPEREYLFNELGLARSSAHFEIQRRMLHAANQKHGSVVVFLNGEKGKEAFKEIEKHLPPEPKIPYSNILRGGDPADLVNKEIANAMKVLPDGAKVFFPIAAGASPEGFTGLIEYAKSLNKGLDVHMLVNGVGEAELKKAVDGGKMRLHALFLGGNMRSLNKEGQVNVIPGYLSDFTRMMKDPDNTHLHYDAIIVRVSPPDKNGNCSLGPNADMIRTIIRERPGIKIIAEINPNIPRTFRALGDNTINKISFASTFNSNAQLAGPPVVPLTDVERTIGNHLGELVDHGATVQIGIGNIFGGFADGLQKSGKGNLKIWTEMFGDPLKDIMDRGIASSAKTGFAFGSDGLYKWLDGNRRVQFEDTETVNDPAKVAAVSRFHAINTALQVNLKGDTNATMGPNGRISSPGGQVEFMSGAARSDKGKSIIAIRSTAKNGEQSTIVLDNYFGTVTTPSESVGYVVTEYGTAKLFGKGEREKTVALINVAHPNFRQQLSQQALGSGLLRQEDIQKIDFNVKPLAPGH